MKRVFGFVLLCIGALLLLDELFSRHTSAVAVIFALVVLIGGWKLAEFTSPGSRDTARRGSKPAVPPGFRADFWHKNIAIDSNAGTVWLREKNGRDIVLQRGDVLGWEMQNSNFTSQALVGPRITPMDNRLLVKTRNLEKPLWTIPFDAHGSLTGRANHLNHEEMKAWYERLNVFINHARV